MTKKQQAEAGLLISKLQFWRRVRSYEFNLQLWGDQESNQNNGYINRHDVEVYSTGCTTLKKLLEDIIAWCERANPSIKYY